MHNETTVIDQQKKCFVVILLNNEAGECAYLGGLVALMLALFLLF